jgi:hypothetical protein
VFFYIAIDIAAAYVAAFVVPFENRPRLEHDGVSYPAEDLTRRILYADDNN